jgi:hypothetical protein
MPKVWTGPKFEMPDRLYRYRPLADEREWSYMEQILLVSTMYGAPPADLREKDPEDCRVAVDTCCTFDQFRQSRYGQEVAQQHPELSGAKRKGYLRRYFKNLMKPDLAPDVISSLQLGVDQYGVICFSIAGDIPTQWRDYASEGKGVCLEFDPLLDLDFFTKVKPVDYVEVLEPANVFIDTIDVQVRKRLYTKLAKYESETEFRGLFNGRAGQQIPFKPEALVRVNPGSEMNEADRGRLEEILRQRLAKTGFKV